MKAATVGDEITFMCKKYHNYNYSYKILKDKHDTCSDNNYKRKCKMFQ